MTTDDGNNLAIVTIQSNVKNDDSSVALVAEMSVMSVLVITVGLVLASVIAYLILKRPLSKSKNG